MGWKWPSLKRAETPDIETMQTHLRGVQGWSDLRNSLGWKLLHGEVMSELGRNLDLIMAGNLTLGQYERLSARIECFRWLAELPDRKYNEHNESLADLRAISPPEGNGSDGPVPDWEDEPL